MKTIDKREEALRNAAPALLAALEALVWQYDNNNGQLCGMALQDARAAIAQATTTFEQIHFSFD